MRSLPEIEVGGYILNATAEHAGGAIVEVTVKCGDDSITRKLNHQGSHDHSEAQFEKDVNDFAGRLALELAAKMRSTELARNFAANS